MRLVGVSVTRLGSKLIRRTGSRHHNRGKSLRTSTSKRSTSGMPKKDVADSESVAYEMPKAFVIGSTAGLLGSLAGMGGGFVMIPLMTSKLLRLSQHQAHGTSLFAVTTTGISGALGYSGQVDYEAAGAIAACGMVTARYGAQATTRISGPVLKKALGVFMICVAPLIPAKTYLTSNVSESGQQRKEEVSTLRRLLVPATIGCCSGFLAGLFGVGGGAVVVPALTVATDMNHYQALGTSLCAMALPAMVGTVTHYSKGNVAIRIAPALAMGAFMGGYFGGKLGMTVEESHLRWCFSGLMLALGTRTLLV